MQSCFCFYRFWFYRFNHYFGNAGRSGLGTANEEERKRKKRLEIYALKTKRRREEEVHLRGDFKTRMRGKLNERQTWKDLCTSQKACEQLDNKKVYVSPDT